MCTVDCLVQSLASTVWPGDVLFTDAVVNTTAIL
jgi:hypothetical protein